MSEVRIRENESLESALRRELEEVRNAKKEKERRERALATLRR